MKQEKIEIEVAGRRIFVRMPRNATDIQFVRSFHYVRWDPKGFCWVIPHYKNNLELLQSYFGQRVTLLQAHPNMEVAVTPSQKRWLPREQLLLIRTPSGRVRVIFAPNAALTDVVRSIPFYQWEEFINYYHKYDINRIDEQMITEFLRYLVLERKVSTSYQNQSINAIKFYFERVLGGKRKVYLVDRPRKERTLPEVLSEEEVINLLSVTPCSPPRRSRCCDNL